MRPVVGADEDLDSFVAQPCAICNSLGNVESFILCDLCGQHFHQACVHLDDIPRGFWYCEPCIRRIEHGKVQDLTVDLDLMQYVF